jgi:hypothetical protein
LKGNLPAVSQNSQANLILDSGIFDEHYYYSHVDAKNVKPANAVEHYLAIGVSLGLNPHPLFHSAFYLKTYSDVASAGINPLVHYILHGASEGRFPNRFFDSRYYSESLPETERAGLNPLTHYLHSHIAEKRATHPQFDTQLYFTYYPEALASGSDPLVHFLEKGEEQKRLAYLVFDPQFYLDTYKDVAAAGLDPVQHYRLYGRAEGRLPRSTSQRFQNIESFEKIRQWYLHSDAAKNGAVLAPLVDIGEESTWLDNAITMKVFWGCPLFEHRLLQQFVEVVQRLPEVRFCIHERFVCEAEKLPANVQVLDVVLNENDLFAGCSLFISPVESSPVSELMLRAIESGSLVICSDDCELSTIISPSECSMLPQGITAEKIVHAIVYASANRQNSATRVQSAGSKLLVRRC